MTSAIKDRTTAPTALGRRPSWQLRARAFGAMFRRDFTVTGKELPFVLAQVLLQPIFFMFIFGRLLTSIGFTAGTYASLLFPGLLALTVVVTAIQGTAFPLVVEFGYTREIDDRLLAPSPVWALAVEKILFAAARGLLAGLALFPVGIWVLGSIPYQASGLVLLVTMLLLACLVGATFGLVLGTFITPDQINIFFSLLFTPLAFLGSVQYPWPQLAQLRWFQILTAFNPITYASEGMRAALIPGVPHMPALVCVSVLLAGIVLFGILGLVGFRRRAAD
ncbi:MAG TPA: ABC transporter permease [Amycolatopsis sp.]|uniref:ABC transporter permease n=1 Tax=Amycolatopsis sp. TaxID=37632 RepID=UPI002B473624|nr:ABC transporter permease [Amycolatopsis sp.]HKS50135.1 ABC transporter permease [Amycolatopsis sp.]